MNIPLIFPARWVCAALFFLLCAGALAADAPLKLEAQLVVGSNDPQIHGTPVSPQIEKKLKRLPLSGWLSLAWRLIFMAGRPLWRR